MKVMPVSYSVGFDNSNKHYKPVISLIDSEKGERIKQIPPESRIKLAENMGKVIDTYA